MRLASRPLVALVTVAAVAIAALALACGPSGTSGRDAVASPMAAHLRCATARHPYPVVLVPGTFEATDWNSVGDTLTAQGYCVYAFGYSTAGVGSIVTSADELRRFVTRVLAATGASRVSLVGHSEGGVMARYYVKFGGGAAKVDDLVALAPPNHGTSTPLVIPGAFFGCVACAQQATGSTLLGRLDDGAAAPAPVAYTNVATRYDMVVTPYQSAFLRGPGARVTNVALQHACPDDQAGHLSITVDPVAVQWIENALSRRGPAAPSFRPRC